MNNDLADVAGIAEADMPPGGAGVKRFVDAIAVGDVAADGALAGAGVYHIGIGSRDGERANGGGVEEAVRDVAPVEAAIGGLPDAASASAHVKGHFVLGVAGDGDHASAAMGTDAAPLQLVQQLPADSVGGGVAHGILLSRLVAGGGENLPQSGSMIVSLSYVYCHTLSVSDNEKLYSDKGHRLPAKNHNVPGAVGMIADCMRAGASES